MEPKFNLTTLQKSLSHVVELLGELVKQGVDPGRLCAAPRRLTPAEQRRKQSAVACYRSQLAQLGVDRHGRFTNRTADEWELAWQPGDA